MCGAQPGPAESGFGRSRPHANREDDLPGGIAVDEEKRRAQPLPRVRDSRWDGLRYGSPADAVVHKLLSPHLSDIAAVFFEAGYPRVLRRRVVHGRNGLLGAVRHERPRPGAEESLGDICGNGHSRRMHALGIDTMGQLALYPNPDHLFKEFGKDAELLLDHIRSIEVL